MTQYGFYFDATRENCKKAADRIYKHSMNIQKNGCFPVAGSGRIFIEGENLFLRREAIVWALLYWPLA